MKKILILLSILVIGATSASAAGGVGVFGSYWDTEDLGPGFGGGVKFKTDIAEFFAFEVRASCITKFDEWDGDDELFVIPIEAGLFFNFPLGDEVPLTLYGGGGGGYAILPEADDIDYDDDFCFFGAGGLEFAMGEGAFLFGEVQYRFLEIDGAETDDGDFDMDGELTGLSFNAGLLFRF